MQVSGKKKILEPVLSLFFTNNQILRFFDFATCDLFHTDYPLFIIQMSASTSDQLWISSDTSYILKKSLGFFLCCPSHLGRAPHKHPQSYFTNISKALFHYAAHKVISAAIKLPCLATKYHVSQYSFTVLLGSLSLITYFASSMY